MASDSEAGCGCLVIFLVFVVIGLIREHIDWLSANWPKIVAIVIGICCAFWVLSSVVDARRIARRNQESKHRFDCLFGNMLKKTERDFKVVEANLKQSEKAADSIARNIAKLDQKIRTLS